jgi:hypothetical protein
MKLCFRFGVPGAFSPGLPPLPCKNQHEVRRAGLLSGKGSGRRERGGGKEAAAPRASGKRRRGGLAGAEGIGVRSAGPGAFQLGVSSQVQLVVRSHTPAPEREREREMTSTALCAQEPAGTNHRNQTLKTYENQLITYSKHFTEHHSKTNVSAETQGP